MNGKANKVNYLALPKGTETAHKWRKVPELFQTVLRLPSQSDTLRIRNPELATRDCYTLPSAMNGFRQQRVWFWIALAAIVIALVALIVPQGHSTDTPAWMALLPAFFVGLLVPFSLPLMQPFLSLGHRPEAPSLAPSFQRPPPFRLA